MIFWMYQLKFCIAINDLDTSRTPKESLFFKCILSFAILTSTGEIWRCRVYL